jgi:hypothetical protein
MPVPEEEMSGDPRFIDVALVVADAACDISASRIDSYDAREVTVKLTEDGFEEYIRELRLQEHDSNAEAWLNGEEVGDDASLNVTEELWGDA